MTSVVEVTEDVDVAEAVAVTVILAGVTDRQEHAEESSEAVKDRSPSGITGAARPLSGDPVMVVVDTVVVVVATVEVKVEAARVAVEMNTV